ncbi:MAG: hypothetical protein ABSE73_08630 [Planctomycetota bacterium]
MKGAMACMAGSNERQSPRFYRTIRVGLDLELELKKCCGIMRIVNHYGEAKAFARASKKNGSDLIALPCEIRKSASVPTTSRKNVPHGTP